MLYLFVGIIVVPPIVLMTYAFSNLFADWFVDLVNWLKGKWNEL